MVRRVQEERGKHDVRQLRIPQRAACRHGREDRPTQSTNYTTKTSHVVVERDSGHESQNRGTRKNKQKSLNTTVV